VPMSGNAVDCYLYFLRPFMMQDIRHYPCMAQDIFGITQKNSTTFANFSLADGDVKLAGLSLACSPTATNHIMHMASSAADLIL
jgi:hypothetical protein